MPGWRNVEELRLVGLISEGKSNYCDKSANRNSNIAIQRHVEGQRARVEASVASG